jgi:hypothetical protein
MTDAIHIFGTAGLLSVIPVVLGYHPTDSLVVVCLQGERHQVGPVARVDLSDYRADPQQLAKDIAFPLLRHAQECVLAFYGLQADAFGFGEKLQEQGLTVLDTLFTDNTPHELNPQSEAENVGLGKVVEINRLALQARVEFNRWIDDNSPADAGLYTAMSDSRSRDEYLAANMSRAVDVLPAVLATCRRVPDPAVGASTGEVELVANLCVTAAVLAYRLGDGAVAQFCLDRALRVSPLHRLSHLMLMVMAVAVPPDALDLLVQDLAAADKEGSQSSQQSKEGSSHRA